MPSGTGAAYHKLMGLENQERYNLGLTFGSSQWKVVPPDLDSSAIVCGDDNYRVLILSGLLQAGHNLIWHRMGKSYIHVQCNNMSIGCTALLINKFHSPIRKFLWFSRSCQMRTWSTEWSRALTIAE